MEVMAHSTKTNPEAWVINRVAGQPINPEDKRLISREITKTHLGLGVRFTTRTHQGGLIPEK